MLSFTSFCLWCETVEAEPVEAGSMTLFFDGNREAMVDMAVDFPAVPGSVFTRTTDVVPLTNQDAKPIDPSKAPFVHAVYETGHTPRRPAPVPPLLLRS